MPAAILLALFLRVPPGRVADALAGVRPGALVGAAVAAFAALLLASHRLRVLASVQRLGLGTRELLRINLIALFYGLFVPGGNVTAGAVRLYEMARRGPPAEAAFAAILRDRVDATAALVVVGCACFAVERPVAGAAVPVAMAAAMAAVLAGYGALLHRPSRRRVGGWLGRLTDRLPVPESPRRRLRRAWRDVGAVSGAGAPVSLAVFGLSLLVHAAGVASWTLLAAAVGLEVGPVTMGWVRTAVMLLTMVPVSVGGIGVREAALLLLLSPDGAAGDRVLALSFLVLLLQGALAVAGGLLQAGAALGERRG